MIEIIIAGIVLGFTLAFMVGPVFFMLIDISLNRGPVKAIVFDLGVIAADVLFIVMIWFGADLIDIRQNALLIFSIGGVLIILFGIYNIINAAKKKRNPKLMEVQAENGKNPTVYLAKGFLMNFLNAGVLAYWLTTSLVMKASVNDDHRMMIIYFAVTVAAYFFTDLGKIYFANRIKERLTDKVLINIEKLVGIILVVFGVLMIARGYINSMGYII